MHIFKTVCIRIIYFPRHLKQRLKDLEQPLIVHITSDSGLHPFRLSKWQHNSISVFWCLQERKITVIFLIDFTPWALCRQRLSGYANNNVAYLFFFGHVATWHPCLWCEYTEMLHLLLLPLSSCLLPPCLSLCSVASPRGSTAMDSVFLLPTLLPLKGWCGRQQEENPSRLKTTSTGTMHPLGSLRDEDFD